MTGKELTESSNPELLRKIDKIKTNKVIDAVIIGFSIGIVAYSAVKNGLSFFTFFPLVIIYLITRKATNNKVLEKQIQKELKHRDLK